MSKKNVIRPEDFEAAERIVKLHLEGRNLNRWGEAREKKWAQAMLDSQLAYLSGLDADHWVGTIPALLVGDHVVCTIWDEMDEEWMVIIQPVLRKEVACRPTR